MEYEYKYCPECGGEMKLFSAADSTSYREKCNTCCRKEKEELEAKNLAEYLAELAKLPMEKRIELIERFMYNHRN